MSLRPLCWWVLVLGVVVVVGCRQFPAPPPPPSPSTAQCKVDSDCAHGVCTDGQCDSTKCHSDAQCVSLICVGQVDGGPPGTCGVRECNHNGDCPLGRDCEVTPQGNQCVGECGTNAECTAPTVCVLDGAGKGTCGGNCRSDTDCPVGNVCDLPDGGAGACISGCHSDATCPPHQICYADLGPVGSCALGCHYDSQCPGCAVCTSGNDGGLGTCYGPDAGAVRQGEPTGLHMTDNLQNSVSFMEANYPGSQLTQVTGIGLKSDGTVDVSNPNDYVSRWSYVFLLPGGQSAQLIFYNQSRKCGTYDDSSTGNYTYVMAPATIAQLPDASQVINSFVGHANCNAPAGATGDAISYPAIDDGGASVILTTQAGDTYFQNSLSATPIVSCQ